MRDRLFGPDPVARLTPLLPAGYRVALHLTGDSARAEDLVAVAVRRAALEPPRFGGRSRKALMLCFLRLLVTAAEAESPGLAGWPESRPGRNGTRVTVRAARWEPLAEFVRRAPLGQLHEALQRLRPHCRAACVLHFTEGLSYRDLATVLGCTVEAVRLHLHHGRAELKARLRDLAERSGRSWEEAKLA